MTKKKSKTIRFAVGSPDEWWSSVWLLLVAKNEVYVGAGNSAMSTAKISLHSSGIWTYAYTSQSGFEVNGNRRLSRWERPPPIHPGLVRGPSICAPCTSFGDRPPERAELQKPITWIRAPAADEVVCFDIHFIDANTTVTWTDSERVIAELPLANGSRVQVAAFRRRMGPAFIGGIEKHLKSLMMRTDAPAGKMAGSMMWIVDSEDKPPVHTIIDAPIAWGPQLTPDEAAAANISAGP